MDGGSSSYDSLKKKVDFLAVKKSDPQKDCKALFGVLSDGGSFGEASPIKKFDALAVEKFHLLVQNEEHLRKPESHHSRYFEYKTLFGVLSDGASSGYTSLTKKGRRPGRGEVRT